MGLSGRSYPYLTVTFTATIPLSREDIETAGGDVPQAIQNEIGASGATVIEVEDGTLEAVRRFQREPPSRGRNDD